MIYDVRDDIEEVLLTEKQLSKKIKELGRRLNEDYADKDPVLIGVLKGSLMFLSDLLREVTVRCSVDFIALSSYGDETETSGVVKMIMDLRESIQGRHVLVVEDIVDTGLTMAYLRDNLMTRHPESFGICALLSKPDSRQVYIDLKYEGFEIPGKFVVGYGLDFGERYRNLPYIATLKPEIYNRRKL